ncbi:hypothetical protein JET14_03795 [Martelella lutilitoris]|uniref:Uncharacterized protein n=1 Tax=Martelella lutilitoris TaxID=2583532 RepID=A0A7T7KM08_9HYPH|nr:hypothetical protein [Martelella lutilitoris]QQM31307.1 hypothetical protein JET14_03795 [Martelella lutilitoris]
MAGCAIVVGFLMSGQAWSEPLSEMNSVPEEVQGIWAISDGRSCTDRSSDFIVIGPYATVSFSDNAESMPLFYPYVLDWIKPSEDGIVLLREQDDAGFVYVIKPDPNGLKAQFRTVSKPDEAPVGASPQELLGGADSLQAKKCASLPQS